MHHSPYLEIRGRTYGFRARIPTDLRCAYGRKTEIRHSLRTKDKAEAVRLCRMRSLEVDAEFAQKRRQLLQAAALQIDRVATLTEEDVKRICTLWTHCVLDSDERTREAGIDDAEFDEMAEQFGANAAELRAALARGRVEIVEQALKGFLFLVGVEVDAASPGYRRLAYARPFITRRTAVRNFTFVNDFTSRGAGTSYRGEHAGQRSPDTGCRGVERRRTSRDRADSWLGLCAIWP